MLVAATITGCRPPPDGSPQAAPAATIASRDLTAAEAIARLWPDDRDVRFAPTTLRERHALADAVPALLAGIDAGGAEAWAGALAGADFAFERWRVDGAPYWVITEAPGSARGAGSYLFRAGGDRAAPRFLLQAPHAYFDRHTGALAARVFFATDDGARFDALFTNSIHRYQSTPGARSRAAHNPADLAHAPDHAFTAATAAARRSGPVVIVQLHGFGDRDDVGGAEAVVSAGDRAASTPRARAVARALGRSLPWLDGKTRRFPEQTLALGATTNSQRRALGAGDDFVHLELAAPARARLLADPAQIARLAAALVAAPQ